MQHKHTWLSPAPPVAWEKAAALACKAQGRAGTGWGWCLVPSARGMHWRKHFAARAGVELACLYACMHAYTHARTWG